MGRHRLRLTSYGNQHPPVGDHVDEQRYEKLPEENEHSIRLPVTFTMSYKFIVILSANAEKSETNEVFCPNKRKPATESNKTIVHIRLRLGADPGDQSLSVFAAVSNRCYPC